jgi:hypothetical protein
MERPELREFRSNPVDSVLADRGRYVSAALTIVRAWMTAGCPEMLKPLASFEDWSGFVRSALVWLGCDDPAASMEAAREDDPELSELRELLNLWAEHLGCDAGWTVRDLAEEALKRQPTVMGEPTDYAQPELRDALLQIAGERGVINTKILGRWIAAKRGRIVDGHRFEQVGTAHGGVAKWAVRRC